MHIRLNPYDPNIAGYYWALGSSNLIAGQIDEAALLLSKARAANPRLYFVHLWLAAPLALKGDLDGARTALAESLKLRPDINSIGAAITALVKTFDDFGPFEHRPWPNGADQRLRSARGHKRMFGGPKRMIAENPVPDGCRTGWCRGFVPDQTFTEPPQKRLSRPRRPFEFHSGRWERRDYQQIASAAYVSGVCSVKQGRLHNFQQAIEFAWNAFGKLGSCHTRQPAEHGLTRHTGCSAVNVEIGRRNFGSM